MNARTQISMDPEIQRRAQNRAKELGLSFAEYVRQIIARDLAPEPVHPPEKFDISSIFDLGESDEPTDIAKDKDKMVGEAVWKEHLRKTGQLKTSKRK